MGKLVRDKIPIIIEKAGKKCRIDVMTSSEYRVALRQKLVEEACEVQKASIEELVEELADVLEVIDAIKEEYNVEEEALLKVKREKALNRGGFKGRVLLKTVEE